QQVFLNIINNAAEAINGVSQSQGTIAIAVSHARREKLAEVKISDTGPGIAPEVLPKIFEPHFTTKKNGHGFGLVICERIVKNHKGHMSAESSSSGTTFTITLPVTQHGAPEAQTT
ncbi:MAG: ATP-binding protein, partial [Candidatus Zixiibacteriota bacterium]